MFPEETLRRHLEGFLPNIRWWPWKGVLKKISFRYYKQFSDIIITIINTDNARFYLPLKTSDTKPQLPENRFFTIGDKYIYEAEFSRDYIDVLENMDEVGKTRYNKLPGKILEASPLTLESTNIVAIHRAISGEYVVKSYRLLSEANLEPSMLTRLYEKKFKNIPALYTVYSLGKDVITIVTEYVRGDGDGGLPFYSAYKKLLSEGKNKGAKGYRLGLASKLGVIIGEMHKKLNLDGQTNNLFGLEEISDNDLEDWIKRIENRYKTILGIMDRLVSRAEDQDSMIRTSYWRDLLENKGRIIVEEAKHRLELFRNGYKARTHQDLHLAQMIYIGEKEDFIITDFEGEPGRSNNEKLQKEPPIRDIATMIRSFQYLAFMTFMEAKKLDIERTAKKLVKNDITWEWRMRHSLSMTLSYISSTVNPNIHGFENEFLIAQYNQLLMPWLVERALYEILYEALYRPEWIPVPLVGLLNPAIPTLSLR